MTDISWLVALLSPRSVSPHPNFQSVDLVTPAGLLGLIIQNRERGASQVRARIIRELSPTEDALIDATRDLFTSEGIGEAIPTLVALALDPANDAAFATTAALLSSIGLSELDRHHEALVLLAAVAERIVDRSDDESLLRAALKQQEAARAAESGRPNSEQRDAARDALHGITPAKVSRYRTSQGARWAAAGTNREIVRLLREANDDLYQAEVVFPDPPTLRQWLRTPHSDLAESNLLSDRSGLLAYVSENFSRFARSGERSVRSEDPVDSPLWRALMLFELAGDHRQAKSHRRILGQTRLMRSLAADPAATRESLRLLRHSEDIKVLKLALGHVRAHGPLVALRAEAEQVIHRRLEPALLRDVELAVLEASAQVLDRAEAKRAFAGVLTALESPVGPRNRRQLAAIQKEQLFRAASALAPVAGAERRLANAVLDLIEERGQIDDQLLSNAHARGLSSVDWPKLDKRTRARWRRWTERASEFGGWDSVRDLVLPNVRPPGAIDSNQKWLDVPSMPQVANELNAVMAGAEAPPWLKLYGEQTLSKSLESAVEESQRGQISFYGVDLADIAAGLVLFVDAELWPSLTRYLACPSIPQSLKAGAMDRIASDPDSVPERVRKILRRDRVGLLTASSIRSPFDAPETQPFPAAVRLLASIQGLSDDETLDGLAQLSAGSTQARLEAARTLAVLAQTQSTVREWFVSSALQLSNDADATVRAEIGRTMAIMLGRNASATTLLTSRLLGLLGEDGFVVPLLVLQGITTSDCELSDALRDRIRVLAKEHIVYAVRAQAAYLLSTIE